MIDRTLQDPHCKANKVEQRNYYLMLQLQQLN